MSDDWLLGIEIGGTKLQLGLGRPGKGLETLGRLRVQPALGAPAILDQIREAYESLLDRDDLRRELVRGAGVGFGGPVDVGNGRTQTSYQVAGWDDFALADWVRS